MNECFSLLDNLCNFLNRCLLLEHVLLLLSKHLANASQVKLSNCMDDFHSMLNWGILLLPELAETVEKLKGKFDGLLGIVGAALDDKLSVGGNRFLLRGLLANCSLMAA